MGARVGGMERWDFVLKVVVTGAEHLSWGWSGHVEECDRERTGTLECVKKNLEPVMVGHTYYPGTWEMEARAQIKASFGYIESLRPTWIIETMS